MKKLWTACILALLMTLVFTFSACADAWACRSCGQTGNTGKFCPNCGSAKPDESWVCPVCGRKLTTNFCDQDGTKRTDGSSSAATVKAGDHIAFGHYPQTASGTDNTQIEWRVLEVQGNKALVISEYGLDARQYHMDWFEMTWEECSLRAWLNSDFLNKAFSSTERAAVLTTKADNSRSQHYKGYSDTYQNYPDTEDRIFLLSYAEANKYFKGLNEDQDNAEAQAEPTAYAIRQGAWTSSDYRKRSGKAAGYWWLRSPGSYTDEASYVGASGSLFYGTVCYTDALVRPAFWLDLNAYK